MQLKKEEIKEVKINFTKNGGEVSLILKKKIVHNNKNTNEIAVGIGYELFAAYCKKIYG